MIKLYKYRPYSEFLFKELLYSELYFSSYKELNDPLDLSVRIDFRPKSEQDVELLLYLTLKNSAINLRRNNSIRNNFTEITEFYANKKKKTAFISKLFKDIIDNAQNRFIPFDFIEEQIILTSKEFGLAFNTELFKTEIKRLSNVFFEKSYVTCFTESYSDFLMWSHYASKHTGICLEFTIDREGAFPYIQTCNRKLNIEKLHKSNYVEWGSKTFSCWDKISKIEYKEEPPTINFYQFSPIYANERDCDLIGLTKSKWHVFANELEKVFSIKTSPWKYEKEWRAIEINFGEHKIPEERIRQYPSEILTGVYFGIRTSKEIKSRVYKIINEKNAIKYYEARLTNERELEFKEWKYCKE